MKTDFKKTLPSYKAKRGVFDVIQMPRLRYLSIAGTGGPDCQDFADAIATLYPVAYALKFHSKIELGKDYVVPPLEALWWAEDWSVFTTNYDKSQWDWSAMLMTPDWLDQPAIDQSLNKVRDKKNPPLLDRLQWIDVDEGLCVQTLHIGPYADEGPTLKQMHEAFIPGEGLALSGKHHEIYLSDFRKTAPEKLKTILRQQVKQARNA